MIQGYIAALADLLGKSVFPFLFVLAFLFFLWNVFRYFIVESASPEGREKARSHAVWGIAALVILLSLWGIINLFLNVFRIERIAPVCPDYNPHCLGETDSIFGTPVNGRFENTNSNNNPVSDTTYDFWDFGASGDTTDTTYDSWDFGASEDTTDADLFYEFGQTDDTNMRE